MSLEISFCFSLSYELALNEARALNHAVITPDLMFCGITKLEDVLTMNFMQKNKVPQSLVPHVIAEGTEILELLRRHKLTPRELRRTLRGMVGDGGYTGSLHTDHIPRADETRSAWETTFELAKKANAHTVGVRFLVATLIDIPNTQLRRFCEQRGVDVQALREEAIKVSGTSGFSAPGISSSQTSSKDSLREATLHPTNDALGEFGRDLVQAARDGEIPEVIGRSKEIKQVLTTLARNSKNNPLLVGEAGVGKTAIVEGIAYQIAVGTISSIFKNKKIIQIDAAMLVAGAKYRGDFESRLQKIIEYASSNPDVILFIDEIHLLVGAGAGQGSPMDAANMLKPAMARGQIKLMGATTDKEYRQYIQKDAALERRFEVIHVGEPSVDDCRMILMSARERLQNHHGVIILDEAIDAAIKLSTRYIRDHRLPDKAFALLDTACAVVQLGMSDIVTVGVSEDGTVTPNLVTEDYIYETLSRQIGRDLSPQNNEIDHILNMEEALTGRVIGQNKAIAKVAEAVKRSYAGVGRGSRPVGVFLFVGPTGVGKTELAKAVAEYLFEVPERLIRIDMSEYMEKHSLARLIGAPPGYVGYNEGGQLTEALYKWPFSVVLLDEIEKAHQDITNIFLQVFDDGRLTDGQGRTIDASNAIFMMTSNLGYMGMGTQTDEMVMSSVRMHFRPELFNRIDDMVIFNPLGPEDMLLIVRNRIQQVQQWLADKQVGLDISEEAIKWLADKGYDPELGVRPLQRLIDKLIYYPISDFWLRQLIGPDYTVEIGLDEARDRIVVQRLTESTM